MRLWPLTLLALLAPSVAGVLVIPEDIPSITVVPAEVYDLLVPAEPVEVPMPQGIPFAPTCTHSEMGRMCSDDFVEPDYYEVTGSEPGVEVHGEESVEPQIEPIDSPSQTTAVNGTVDSAAERHPHAQEPETDTPTLLPPPDGQDPRPANEVHWHAARDEPRLLPTLLSVVAFALPGAVILKTAWALFMLRGQQKQATYRLPVLKAISNNPGIRHLELVRVIGRGNGTVEHHVRCLLKEGMIASIRRAGVVCYFPIGMMPDIDACMHFALSGRTSRQIALELAGSPGLRLSDIAHRVGIGVPSAHYQTRKLEEAGVLVREGRSSKRLKLSSSAEAWLTRLNSSGDPPAVNC